MLRFACFVALLALTAGASLSFDKEWESFKTEYNKIYSSAQEEASRRSIFITNLKKINAHNEQADNGVHSYRFGVNMFADMTPEEFEATRLGFKRPAHRPTPPKYDIDLTESIPESVDWRNHSIVTQVKDQGSCGSCWAFSAIASIESAHAQKTGKLVEFSEQNLIDCSWDYGNKGCNGGLMDNAFDYIKANKGVDTETCYPYTSKRGRESRQCKYQSSCKGATLSSYVDIPEGDEDALAHAVAKRVVSIAVDASTFQYYSHGILNSKRCKKADLNHGVTIVGYGTENGTPYWIVKNSWGPRWGENGYLRMIRGKNMCGIAEAASYPVV